MKEPKSMNSSVYKMMLQKLTRIITPGLKNSHYVYFDTLKAYIHANSRWLDLGCGHQIIPNGFHKSEEVEYIIKNCKILCGIDSDSYQLFRNRIIKNRILCDISSLPFRENAFNIITTSMVFEHIKDPLVLHEIKRVLEPRGFLIIHTVNLLSYFGFALRIIPNRVKSILIKYKAGKVGDSFPAFYRMNNYFRIKKLALEYGFKVCILELIETSVTTEGLSLIINLMELIIIRMLRLKALKLFRTNIICVLQRVDSCI